MTILKVVSAHFARLGKTSFISLQKLFLFSKKSNLNILYIQDSWRHKMTNHKKKYILLNNLVC